MWASGDLWPPPKTADWLVQSISLHHLKLSNQFPPCNRCCILVVDSCSALTALQTPRNPQMIRIDCRSDPFIKLKSSLRLQKCINGKSTTLDSVTLGPLSYSGGISSIKYLHLKRWVDLFQTSASVESWSLSAYFVSAVAIQVILLCSIRVVWWVFREILFSCFPHLPIRLHVQK